MSDQQITVWTPELSVSGVESEFHNLAKVHGAVHWEAEKNYAIQLLYKSDFAVKVAQNNPVSVQNAVRNVAAIGLTLNPALKYAYLVPRDGMICLDVSYMGLMHLAQETGSVVWGQAKLVHENDQYINKGLSVEPEHTYQAFGDRGQIVGCYCVVKLADGDYLTHEMSIADIYAIRDRSSAWKAYQAKKAKSPGPWGTDEKEMIKKTVVKQASKYWPKVERMQQAIDVINTESGEGIDFESERRDYTDEQYQKYHHYLENGTSIEFTGYIRSLDEIASSALYNSFEKGDKVKGKERATQKEKEGIQELLHRQSKMTVDDPEVREEAVDGLNELERQILIRFNHEKMEA